MESTDATFNERVVKIVETCEGAVDRVYYCIHDPDFGHWMSTEEFDEAIWTQDPHSRREFDSRYDAERTLEALRRWRREESGLAVPVEIPEERDAA